MKVLGKLRSNVEGTECSRGDTSAAMVLSTTSLQVTDTCVGELAGEAGVAIAMGMINIYI